MMGGGLLPPLEANTAGGSGQPLQEVERVRSVFPETWLWSNASVGYKTILPCALSLLCIPQRYNTVRSFCSRRTAIDVCDMHRIFQI